MQEIIIKATGRYNSDADAEEFVVKDMPEADAETKSVDLMESLRLESTGSLTQVHSYLKGLLL